MVNSSKYVVLDVETNGLSCLKDDLLSISLYLPDKEETYNRFLPLEKNDSVVTTQFNGITEDDLKDKVSLTQDEVNDLIRHYELDKRIILTYGNLDERFIRRYFKEHKLDGVELLNIYNFKRDVISSSFAGGLISKDNLCKALNIEGVKEVHSGINDCKLEWELFRKLDGGQFLVTGAFIFRFSKEYYVPVSYLTTYPNFKRHKEIPEITYEKKLIKSFPIDNLIPFSNNLNGLIMEDILFRLCGATKQDNSAFLCENKSKLEFLGCINEYFKNTIPINIDASGDIVYAGNKDEEDKELFELINSYRRILEVSLYEVVDYIKNDLFNGEDLMSQELTINEETKVMALSDISSVNKVLEIKTHKYFNWDNFVCQLYYQSKGRETYCLVIDWNDYLNSFLENPKIEIYKVLITANKKAIISRDEKFELQRQKYQKIIKNPNIKIIKYNGYDIPADLRCDICGGTFKKKIRLISTNPGFKCPNCLN